MLFKANPIDPSLNVAIKLLARRMNPSGWDQVAKFDDAPTTLEGLRAYYGEHGKLCIAEEDSDGTIYDCPDTNHHLRAWHDAIHLRYNLAFNAAGEAAACYVHVAQVFIRYGDNPTTRLWASLLMGDLLALVHFHQRTGEWPMDKRAFALSKSLEWDIEANALIDTLAKARAENSGPEWLQIVAINRARYKWGYPWEADL